MKKRLLFCLGVVLLSQPAFAPWAAHLVISPASAMPMPKDAPYARFSAEAAAFARGVTVFAIPKERLTVAIDAEADEGEMGKGYYLIVSKKRLAVDALDLREVLRSVGDNAANKPRPRVPEGFEEVRPLKLIQWNGKAVVGVVLEREKAYRSSVVWDHKCIYDRGAWVADGGLSLTYAVPAFVQSLEKTRARERQMID